MQEENRGLVAYFEFAAEINFKMPCAKKIIDELDVNKICNDAVRQAAIDHVCKNLGKYTTITIERTK